MINIRARILANERAESVAEIDWAAIYNAQLPRVYNYFRFRLGDNALAEELTAQTFERAWRERRRYRHDLGAFSTWLFTIARRIGANHHRRYRWGMVLPLE